MFFQYLFWKRLAPNPHYTSNLEVSGKFHLELRFDKSICGAVGESFSEGGGWRLLASSIQGLEFKKMTQEYQVNSQVVSRDSILGTNPLETAGQLHMSYLFQSFSVEILPKLPFLAATASYETLFQFLKHFQMWLGAFSKNFKEMFLFLI